MHKNEEREKTMTLKIGDRVSLTPAYLRLIEKHARPWQRYAFHKPGTQGTVTRLFRHPDLIKVEWDNYSIPNIHDVSDLTHVDKGQAR